MGVSKVLCIRECANCHKEVEIRHKHRVSLENIFCSRECSSEYIKNKNLNCTCPVCGKKFHRKPYELKRNNKHIPCCSMKCLSEYRKLKYLGENNPNYNNRGDKNPLFRGDALIHGGYRWLYVPEHPFTVECGRVREHRIVAEKYLLTDECSVEINGKKYLSPEYDVHHINQDKLDNRLENLQILTRSEHQKLHHRLKKENK